MDINLLSAMHLTRIAMPHLVRRARISGVPSQLIFVNSTLGLESGQAIPGTAPYAASKAALAAFARVCLWGMFESPGVGC